MWWIFGLVSIGGDFFNIPIHSIGKRNFGAWFHCDNILPGNRSPFLEFEGKTLIVTPISLLIPESRKCFRHPLFIPMTLRSMMWKTNSRKKSKKAVVCVWGWFNWILLEKPPLSFVFSFGFVAVLALKPIIAKQKPMMHFHFKALKPLRRPSHKPKKNAKKSTHPVGMEGRWWSEWVSEWVRNPLPLDVLYFVLHPSKKSVDWGYLLFKLLLLKTSSLIGFTSSSTYTSTWVCVRISSHRGRTLQSSIRNATHSMTRRLFTSLLSTHQRKIYLAKLRMGSTVDIRIVWFNFLRLFSPNEPRMKLKHKMIGKTSTGSLRAC